MSPAFSPLRETVPAGRVRRKAVPVPARVPAGEAGCGRIGPNAIVRVGEAVTSAFGPAVARQIFEEAGLSGHFACPPTSMVDEREVTRLHAVLRERAGLGAARRVSREAGRLTAAYLVAHRIPRAMRHLLPRLPAPLASRILLAAMARHAWTFVGSGAFEGRHERAPRLRIRDCPVCRGAAGAAPLCDYYAGTFEHLYRTLVHPAARCTELACAAAGAPCCDFELRWG